MKREKHQLTTKSLRYSALLLTRLPVTKYPHRLKYLGDDRRVLLRRRKEKSRQ